MLHLKTLNKTYSCCNSLVLCSQDQMLTKEEILENWNMFVGSQATNYGEDLTKNHDELWGLFAASDLCVRRVVEHLCLQRQNHRLLHILPPPQPPLHPFLIRAGQMSVCWIVHCRYQTRGGIRVCPTTNTKGPSWFHIDGSVSDIQEQSQTQWTYFPSMVPSSRIAGFAASEICVDSL